MSRTLAEFFPGTPVEAPGIVAIIPARGGSKGIPRKNLADLGGHPLVAWAIMAARAVLGPANVYVSTDDEEIAEVSREYGAQVPFLRPRDLGRDNSLIGEAMGHMLAGLTERGVVIRGCLELYPTHPFRTRDMLERAVAAIKAGHRRFSTVKSCHVRPWRYVSRELDGTLRPMLTQVAGIRLGTYSRSYGLVTGWSVSPTTRQSVMMPVTDPIALIDIDTPADLENARLAVDVWPRGEAGSATSSKDGGGARATLGVVHKAAGHGEAAKRTGPRPGERHPESLSVVISCCPEPRGATAGEAFSPEAGLQRIQDILAWTGPRRVAVASSSPEMLRAARKHGWEALPAPEPRAVDDDDVFLPPGARAALTSLRSRTDAPDAPCLVVDICSQPFVPGLGERLLSEWARARELAWTTLSPPTDHPCQLRQFYRSVASSFLHILEDETESHRLGLKGFAASRSFGHIPALARERAWCHHLDAAAPERLALLDAYAVGDIPCVLSNGSTMRLLFPSPLLAGLRKKAGCPEGARLVGLTLPGGLPDHQLLLVAQGGRLFGRLLGPDRRNLVAYLCLVGQGEERLLRYAADAEMEVPALPATSGFPVGLLRETEAGAYDLDLPLPHTTDLWTVRSGTVWEKGAHKELWGRQKLPECYVPDGRISVGSPSVLIRANTAAEATGLLHGCVVSSEPLRGGETELRQEARHGNHAQE